MCDLHLRNFIISLRFQRAKILAFTLLLVHWKPSWFFQMYSEFSCVSSFLPLSPFAYVDCSSSLYLASLFPPSTPHPDTVTPKPAAALDLSNRGSPDLPAQAPPLSPISLRVNWSLPGAYTASTGAGCRPADLSFQPALTIVTASLRFLVRLFLPVE